MSPDPSETPLTGAAATIAAVSTAIDETFARLDACCALPAGPLHHRPPYPQAWTAAEHLEHVSLANHFLLLTIGKGVAAALRRARTQAIPQGESDLERLAPIAEPDSFPWEPPGHMLPTGTRPVAEVRKLLAAQQGECRGLLKRMGSGEGRLCAFRMSVYSLGRLDMYQWFYFLTQHGRWHLEFLARRDPTTLVN